MKWCWCELWGRRKEMKERGNKRRKQRGGNKRMKGCWCELWGGQIDERRGSEGLRRRETKDGNRQGRCVNERMRRRTQEWRNGREEKRKGRLWNEEMLVWTQRGWKKRYRRTRMKEEDRTEPHNEKRNKIIEKEEKRIKGCQHEHK